MDLAEIVSENIQAMNQQLLVGLKAGKAINRVAIAALKAAYADALKDENVKIPSPLHCAIENILRLGEEK